MNNRVNLLEGNIFSSLTKLALPIMATSLIQMAYNMIDMIWIGRIGSAAVAAVGAAGMYLWLSNGFISISRVGGQVNVAQRYGAGDIEQTRLYASNSLQLSFIIGLIYSLVMIVFTGPLIGFFNLNELNTIINAEIYLKITGGCVVFTFISQTMTGIITSTGNSRTPFIINTIGLITNIVLDPILIFGFGFIKPMGVVGAAIATIIAQILVCIMYIWYAFRDDILFTKKMFQKTLSINYVKPIIKIGLPIALEGLIFTFISMIIARIIAVWGDVAIAVQKVGSQIESISWMSAEGFGGAINSFVGQNYGAGNYKRAKSGYIEAMKIIIVLGIVTTCILIFYPAPIFYLFIPEMDVLPYGIAYLQILGVSQLFMCIELLTAGAFSGFGRTIPPSVVSITLTGARIPMALALSSYMDSINGIWWAITISSILKGIVLLVLFIIFLRKNDKNI